MGRPRLSIECRVERITESGCWIWLGGLDRHGYGIMTTNVLAHRASYSHFVGEIPRGMCVCHRCDIRCCVNPAHLFIDTNQGNAADKVRKNRQARGTSNGMSKLSEESVREILASKEAGPSLARRFGVTRRVIYLVRRRETWRHINAA